MNGICPRCLEPFEKKTLLINGRTEFRHATKTPAGAPAKKYCHQAAHQAISKADYEDLAANICVKDEAIADNVKRLFTALDKPLEQVFMEQHRGLASDLIIQRVFDFGRSQPSQRWKMLIIASSDGKIVPDRYQFTASMAAALLIQTAAGKVGSYYERAYIRVSLGLDTSEIEKEMLAAVLAAKLNISIDFAIMQVRKWHSETKKQFAS